MTHDQSRNNFQLFPTDPLSYEVNNATTHIDIIDEHLEKNLTPDITTDNLVFEQKDISQSILPTIVMTLLESGAIVDGINVSSQLCSDDDRYTLTINFELKDIHGSMTTVSIIAPASLDETLFPTGIAYDNGDAPWVHDTPIEEISAFLHSIIYSQDEMEAALNCDIRDVAVFDTVLQDLRDKSSTQKIAKYYRIDIGNDTLHIERTEYAVGPNGSLGTMTISHSQQTKDMQESDTASVWFCLTEDMPPEFYVYLPQISTSEHQRVDEHHPDIQLLFQVVRGVAQLTTKGQEFFVSDRTLDAIIRDAPET